MPDVFTKKKRSEVMARIRSRGNKATELRMIEILRAHGITGWRRQQRLRISTQAPMEKRSAAGVSVDFVFRNARVAVFVDGCFWHACPVHGTQPRGNRAFWREKLVRNAERDRRVTRGLRRAGWRVLRVWEHELARRHEARLVRRLTRVLTPPA
jgi:DNA mismatch endonuclease, patch repair protein